MSPIAMFLYLAGLSLAMCGVLSLITVAPRVQASVNAAMAVFLGACAFFAASAAGLALLRRHSPRSAVFRSGAVRIACLTIVIAATVLVLFGVVV